MIKSSSNADINTLLWGYTLECGFGSTRKLSKFNESRFKNKIEKINWLEKRTSLTNLKISEKECLDSTQQGINLINILDKQYPEELKNISDPPLILFSKGQIPKLKKVAIVGSRKCSQYGKNIASKSASISTQHGWAVVSGLAFGIDSSAHASALEACKSNLNERRSSGIAVLGTGLENIYPKQNRHLAEQLTNYNGCVISEFGLKSSARKHHFPRRNRIISGLSDITIIVEAKEKSGSLITAQFALEQNREVLAVPGNITSSLSYGSNRLISQGARIMDSYKTLEDLILEEGQHRSIPNTCLNENSSTLLSILKERGELHFTEAQELTSLKHHELRAEVSKLELSGFIHMNSNAKIYLNN